MYNIIKQLDCSFVCVDLNHSNHVSSMDEEKAMQNLLEFPIEFVKYPFQSA